MDESEEPTEKVVVFVLDQRRVPETGDDARGEHYHVVTIATDNPNKLATDLREECCEVTITDRVGYIFPFGTLRYLEATYRCQWTAMN